MKGRFLASVSPQLIDLSLQKDWYVSLQTPWQDDLKLAVEQFKVWHWISVHCTVRSILVSCHFCLQRRALNPIAQAMSSQGNLRDILLTLIIGTSESDLIVRNPGTWEYVLAKKCGNGIKE